MNVYIYECVNNVFVKLDVIDSYKSLIWIKRYQALGECELYIAATETLMKLFQKPHIFLVREDDPKSMMMVTTLELQTDPEGMDYLIVKGQAAERVLGQRITWGQMTIATGTNGAAAEILINANLTDVSRPTGTAPSIVERRQRRGMPFVKLGEVVHAGSGFRAQLDSENLLDVVLKICVDGGIGLRSRFVDGYIYIDIYIGKDRTISQSVNERVIFSPDYENIGKTSYLYDMTQIATMAVVLGEGQGSARERPRVEPTEESGIDLFEIKIDASNISRTTTDGEMPQAEYIECLTQEGKMQLAQRKVKRSFEGEIVTQQMYVCGESYDLGDKVTVQNEYGLTGSAVVMEISDVIDDTGRQIYPTLSEWALEE